MRAYVCVCMHMHDRSKSERSCSTCDDVHVFAAKFDVIDSRLVTATIVATNKIERVPKNAHHNYI